jgi:Flp pilus assembly CpaE family ATPase
MKTLRYGEQSLFTAQEILDELGLEAGQSIDFDTARRVVELSAASLLADIDLQNLAGEDIGTDGSALRKVLAQRRQNERS